MEGGLDEVVVGSASSFHDILAPPTMHILTTQEVSARYAWDEKLEAPATAMIKMKKMWGINAGPYLLGLFS